MGARYLAALRTTVAASAAPYGYTLTIWTSGAVLSHARGIPSARDALLFLVGAVGAFALVAAVAVTRPSERLVPVPAHAAIWGALHFVSVGLAIGAASTVAHLVESAAAWLLGGFLSTFIYLLASASQLALARIAVRGQPNLDDGEGNRSSRQQSQPS